MRNLKIAVLVLVTAIVSIALVKGETLTRLYHTITLFDKGVIVENFSGIAGKFPTYEIKASTAPSKFEQDLGELPSHFEYKGQQQKVSNFLDETSTTALLVLDGNTIRYEDYLQGTTGEDYRISWSTAKSFLSALFGIAVHEGAIESIDDPVTMYAPKLIGSGYDGVRIKDVLQMSSGVRFDEDYSDFDSDINRFGRTFALGGSFDDFAATLVNERAPGKYLHYVSIDTHVLGMVIRGATGRPMVDYFQEKLWSKIQPESSVYYVVDNENEPMVLGGMNLRTRDFARFGQLYLNNGKWGDEQVVPSEWVRASVTPDAPHLVPGNRESSSINLGYGYQWWIPEQADQEFMALGIYGQFIYVNQRVGVVIVKNSAHIGFDENNFESATETVAFFRAVVELIESSR